MNDYCTALPFEVWRKPVKAHLGQKISTITTAKKSKKSSLRVHKVSSEKENRQIMKTQIWPQHGHQGSIKFDCGSYLIGNNKSAAFGKKLLKLHKETCYQISYLQKMIYIYIILHICKICFCIRTLDHKN